MKNEEKIMETARSRIRRREPELTDVEERMRKWFPECLLGRILLQKAENCTEKLGHSSFKASNGAEILSRVSQDDSDSVDKTLNAEDERPATISAARASLQNIRSFYPGLTFRRMCFQLYFVYIITILIELVAAC